MAKVTIKSEKLTPFGGIFSVMEHFDALLFKTIDASLGLRCMSYGYQYSEIIRSLMCAYFCGGFCVEDAIMHIMRSSHFTRDSVPAKWVRISRQFVLNIYLTNRAYADLFSTGFG